MDSDRIILNIGGARFHTTRDTISREESMLLSAFSGRFPLKVDKEDNSLFIDRDPKHFSIILNHLRDGRVPLPECERELDEILTEAKFYGLELLVSAVEQALDQLRSHSSRKRSKLENSNTSTSNSNSNSINSLHTAGNELRWEAQLLKKIGEFAAAGTFSLKTGETKEDQEARINIIKIGVFERRECLRIAFDAYGQDDALLAAHLNLLATDALSLHWTGFTHLRRGLP
jgi:hypothetical protein